MFGFQVFELEKSLIFQYAIFFFNTLCIIYIYDHKVLENIVNTLAVTLFMYSYKYDVFNDIENSQSFPKKKKKLLPLDLCFTFLQ